jgi:hypothetical protein
LRDGRNDAGERRDVERRARQRGLPAPELTWSAAFGCS